MFLEPDWARDYVDTVEIEFDPAEDDCDNPAGACSRPIKLDEKGLRWKIDNARWFSTQADQCNISSEYKITGKAKVHGAVVNLKSEKFTVSASFGENNSLTCLDGLAFPVTKWAGLPQYHVVQEPMSLLHSVRVGQGSFTRNVKSSYWVKVNVFSQYYNMIVSEEIYHANHQISNPDHHIFGALWRPENVINKLADEVFVSVSEETAISMAKAAFTLAKASEELRSAEVIEKNRKTIEMEAKDFAGSTHRVRIECAYGDNL